MSVLDTKWHSSSEPTRWEVWLWRYTDADSYERDYRFAGHVRKVRLGEGGAYGAYDSHGLFFASYAVLDSARGAVKAHALKAVKDSGA